MTVPEASVTSLALFASMLASFAHNHTVRPCIARTIQINKQAPMNPAIR